MYICSGFMIFAIFEYLGGLIFVVVSNGCNTSSTSKLDMGQGW